MFRLYSYIWYFKIVFLKWCQKLLAKIGMVINSERCLEAFENFK